MLLSEAIDPGQLATKQSVIDRLKADLTAAGIKHKDRGSTSIDIFNNVTVAQPIYSAVATKDGFIKIIDDSAKRTALTKMPEDATKLYGTYDHRGRLSLLSPQQSKTSYETNYYEMGSGYTYQRTAFNTGIINIVNGASLRKAANGKVLYPHFTYNAETETYNLKSVDVIVNGQLVTYEHKKRVANDEEWLQMYDAYTNGSNLTVEQAYQAVLSYILDTIGSTTVNAAVKGGKDKYLIAPAEKLKSALLKLFDADEIVDNLDTVANTNMEMPKIKVTPIDGITINIFMRRTGLGEKAVETIITNIDKTLLYYNVRANINEIRDPDYEINIARFVDAAEKIGHRKYNFDYNTDRVLNAIIQYVNENEPKLAIASANKQHQMQIMARAKEQDARRAADRKREAAKTNAYFARQEELAAAQKQADDEALAIQKAHDARKRELLRNARRATSKKDYDSAVDSLFGSAKDYDDFLNKLNDF